MPYLTNNTIQLHYDVIGTGIPIILHHGSGNSMPDWYDLGYVDALKDRFQLILFDARGHGKSDKPHDTEAYSPHEMASDSVVILDALGIEKAYCYGYSMGGRTAFALMQYYPDRFDGYIIGGMHPYGNTQFKEAASSWIQKGVSNFVAEIEKHCGRFPSVMRDRYLNENDAKALLAELSYVWPDMSHALEKIEKPCVLYAGEWETAIEKIRTAEKLLKNGEVSILKGLNHCTAFWQAAASIVVIDHFFETYGK